MKIDNEALVIIGLGAAVYYFMNKKTTTIAVVKNKLIDAVDTGMEGILLESSINSTPKSQADNSSPDLGTDGGKCPDEVMLGCGMPPHKFTFLGKTINTCTSEKAQGTPFIRECIDNGFTTARSRPV